MMLLVASNLITLSAIFLVGTDCTRQYQLTQDDLDHFFDTPKDKKAAEACFKCGVHCAPFCYEGNQQLFQECCNDGLDIAPNPSLILKSPPPTTTAKPTFSPQQLKEIMGDEGEGGGVAEEAGGGQEAASPSGSNQEPENPRDKFIKLNGDVSKLRFKVPNLFGGGNRGVRRMGAAGPGLGANRLRAASKPASKVVTMPEEDPDNEDVYEEVYEKPLSASKKAQQSQAPQQEQDSQMGPAAQGMASSMQYQQQQQEQPQASQDMSRALNQGQVPAAQGELTPEMQQMIQQQIMKAMAGINLGGDSGPDAGAGPQQTSSAGSGGGQEQSIGAGIANMAQQFIMQAAGQDAGTSSGGGGQS